MVSSSTCRRSLNFTPAAAANGGTRNPANGSRVATMQGTHQGADAAGGGGLFGCFNFSGLLNRNPGRGGSVRNAKTNSTDRPGFGLLLR